MTPIGYTRLEVVQKMMDSGFFGSVDKFMSLIAEAQNRALVFAVGMQKAREVVAECSSREAALVEMVRINQELGLYDQPEAAMSRPRCLDDVTMEEWDASARRVRGAAK